MMWFDATPRKLEEKILIAAEYFRRNYYEDPNICQVCPEDIGDLAEGSMMENITIRTNPALLPGHLWLGIEPIPMPEFHPIGFDT